MSVASKSLGSQVGGIWDYPGTEWARVAPVGIWETDLSYAGEVSAPRFEVMGKEVWDQIKEDLLAAIITLPWCDLLQWK